MIKYLNNETYAAMRSGVRMHIGSNFDNWSNKMGGLDRIFWSCLVSLLLLLLVCAPQAHAADNAQFISQSVPTTMVPGQVYTVSVTMQNTGTTTWVSTGANPYRLGAQNPENNWNWGLNRVEVASPVAPGSTYTFTFNVTAPPTAGTYNFQWGMLIENITWFGSTSPNTVVNVATPVPVNGAQFVSQTVPSSMVAGNVYSVSVTMQNTGNTTWVSTGANPYSLAAENPVNNLIWSAGRAYLSSNVAPGASYTFTFNVMAPSTAGAYNFQWGMVEENVVWFGGLSTNAVVNVIAPVNSAQFVSQSVPSSMVAGTTYSASVTMKNTGNTTWIPTGTNPYRLGSQNPQENATWGTSREYMVTSVAPGASYTFSFSVTPPVTAGVYNFQWEMLTEGLAWFGSPSSNVPVTVTLPVPVSQTISFPNTGGTTFGVPLLLSATASSHLPVTYTSNTPSVCSATTTSAIPVGVGVCIITASQPGNAYYLAAPAVQQTFGFSIGNQTITLASIANRAFSTAPISISASATSGLPVSLSGSGACSVSGATATLVGIGTCTISATQFGSNSYNPAPTANTAFSVTIGSQVISFAAIPTQAISSGSVGATATATSGLAVSFASTTPTVCNISGSSINLLAAGTCSVTASQSGNANFNAAANITRSFTVTKAAQTITFPGISQYGDAVGTFPSLVFAYASSGLPVAITSLTTSFCTVSNGSVTFISVGTCTIAVNQAGNASYAAAPQVTQSVAVIAGTQSISFAAMPQTVVVGGTSPFAISATSSSGLAVTFSGLTLKTCTVSGSTVTVTGAGICTIAANQAGSSNYAAATQVTQSINVIAETPGNNSMMVSQSVPSSMRAGQPYTVTVSMLNTGTTTWTEAAQYRLGAQNPQNSRLWTISGRATLPTGASIAPGKTAVFSIPVTAPTPTILGAYDMQWQMVQDGVAWFGPATTDVQVSVGIGPGPSATLTASPTNVRMVGATPATLTFTGSGAETGHTITKLELFQGTAEPAAYAAAPVHTVTGTTSSLAMNFSLTASVGDYWYKLRSTDDQGVATDSAPVIVNVTGGTLLGLISGVRIDSSNKPQLVGWACQPGVNQALGYQVILDAPTVQLGGQLLTSGTASLTTEPDNAAVQAQCSTPGIGHHFNVDLSSYTAQYSGRQLYVQATAASGGTVEILACNDNNCTMPGTMRIGLTTPANGDQYVGPATVFMRALISGSAGPFDAVAFSVDGTWIPGTADTAAGAYYANSASLPARATPYLVQAMVRQGNTTLYSTENMITIGATSSVTVQQISPVSGANFYLGTPITLSAAVVGSAVQSVKFYSATTLLGVGTNSAGTWSYIWSGAPAGAYGISTKAFDGAGNLLATSAVINITVGTAAAPSVMSATPVPVAMPAAAAALLSSPDAGTLPGALSVDANGAALYSLPIAVPPGTAGLQPNLSLNYSSQANNGLLGLGWSLGGMSSVHRCGKTIAQDSVNGRISFDIADRLCLDGQRLVLVNLAVNDSNYWADGAQFHTETDSFSRITAMGSLTGGTRSFKVETKDGRVMTFGSTAASVDRAILGTVLDGSGTPVTPSVKNGPLSWAVDRISDRAGNFVSFDYQQDGTTGEHLPTFLRYGGAGQSSYAAVQFVYDPTPRPDAWKRYVDEARNDLRNRIIDIKTYVGNNLDGDVVASGTIVRDYALKYETSLTSGRSLLDSVQACARNPQTAAMECLPATTFTWGKPDPGKTAGFISQGMWPGAPILTTWNPATGQGINHADFFAFADFENHGYTDALEKRIASVFSPDSDGSAMANPVPMGTMATQYRYFHNTGSGFAQYQYQLDTGENFVVLNIGDFNGDGAPDLLVATAGAAKICLSPLGQPGSLGAPGSTITFTCQSNLPAIGANASKSQPYVIDVVGDGRAAHYGPVNSLGVSAQFCMQTTCTTDMNPPLSVLSSSVLDLGSPNINEQRYVSFDQTIDFTGSGKNSDLRWTQPFLMNQNVDQENQPGQIVQWINLAPQIISTSFQLPGMALGTDQLAPYTYPGYSAPPTTGTVQWPYGFDQPHRDGDLSADFNSSGYQGVLFGFLEYGYSGSARLYNKAQMTLCLSTGRALDCGVRQKYSGTTYMPVQSVGNFVGDGAPSVLVQVLSYPSGSTPVPTGQLQMCRVTGDDTSPTAGTDPTDKTDKNMTCQPWGGVAMPAPSSYPLLGNQAYFMDLLGTGRTQLMLYHSGTQDANNNYTEDGRWEVFAPVDVAVDGQALDRIYKVTNGLGATASVQFADGLPSGVVSQSGSRNFSYPQHLTSGIGKVVSQLTVSNGVSADHTTSYQYKDAALDLAGRGSLGFGQVTATDQLTGMVTVTSYRQDWPFTGMVLFDTVTASNGTIVSATQNGLNVMTLAQAGGATTVFPYIANSVVTRRDLDGSDLGTVTTGGVSTSDVQYDSWGNLLNSKVTTVATQAQSWMVFSTSTVNTYDNFPANATYRIGELRSKVIARSVSGQPVITRTKTFDYASAGQGIEGLLLDEIVEPTNAIYTLTTSYQRDQFGNIAQTSQSWLDPLHGAQTMRILGGTTYETHGRFPQVRKNATCFTNGGVCQSETWSYDAATGAKTSVVDINNLITKWTVNGFGRVLTEVGPDSTETDYYQKQCNGACPNTSGGAPAVLTITDHVTAAVLGGVRVAMPELRYIDSAGHPLRSQTWGFSGSEIDTDATYDARGRVYQNYQPAYSGASPVLAGVKLYDDLNRATSVQVPDETGTLQTTTMAYSGLSVVTTNPKSQHKTEVHDALGQLIQTVDAIGGTTQFTFDSFGNLVQTNDPMSNQVNIAYDLLGRKTTLSDPDLGTITYGIDPRGLQWQQVSPNERLSGQTSTFQYDVLDRLVLRSEPDLSSYWVFDQAGGASTCTATASCGKLVEAYTMNGSLKQYDRLLGYDSVGRPVSTVTTVDALYTMTTTYDIWGRLSGGTAQRGSGPLKTFGRRYNGNGYLAQVLRGAGSGAQVLWQANQQDASDRVINATLGNGLVVSRDYNAYTGRLADAGLAAGSSTVLHEGYFYDVLGNVSQRSQYWNNSATGFIEDFTYDDVNRLSTSTVEGLSPQQQQFAYDASGNITSKTGAGTYAYPAAGASAVRPHAVSAVTSVGSFGYDADGNMLSGAGRSVTWTSFDMPVLMSGSQGSSTFLYGPEHQRSRQTRSDGTVIAYADGLEADTLNGNVTVKTYWPMGLGVEIDVTGATGTALNWTHADRLGSVVAITDQNGVVRESMEYDAWGARRGLSNVPVTAPATYTPIVDNKGFTGQEMLDQLALVHLNGRVYDPFVARFLSADPLIQDPSHSQSYNRYTYVWNNPTNLTDPTGFEGAPPAGTPPPPPTGTNIPCQTKERCETVATGMRLSGYVPATGKPRDRNNNQPVDGKSANSGGSLWDRFKAGVGDFLTSDQLHTALEMSSVMFQGGGMGAGMVSKIEGEQLATIAAEQTIQRVVIVGERAVQTEATTALSRWSVGNDVYQALSGGAKPAWSTVRGRFWKNEAARPTAAAKYGAENIPRMKMGRAPQRYNPDKGDVESMELSHEPIPARDGGTEFVPRWPQDHAAVDPFRRPGY